MSLFTFIRVDLRPTRIFQRPAKDRLLDGAAVLLLMACAVGLFWKITLTTQYTWLDSPDLVNQVVPWLQEQTRQWKSGAFPLWDSHHWSGYPMAGQAQPGVLFPLNWLLALTPFDTQGHLRLGWLNWYFVLIHFVAALAAFLLCRDRGCSRTASVAAGIVFGLGGFLGSNAWPQMLNGVILAPVVFLFVFRVLDNRRPHLSAAAAGCFLGICLWSGHHQLPTFVGIACAAVVLWAILSRNLRPQTGALALFWFAALTLTTGLPALITSKEFYSLSLREVGTAKPVDWGDRVPYIAHEQFSLPPGQLVGLVIPFLYANVTIYAGLTVCAAALLAALTSSRTETRIWMGLAIGSIFFSFGKYTPFHGILYALVPTVDKSRNVQFGVALLSLSLAVLAAFGLDYIARQQVSARVLHRVGWGITGIGALMFAFFIMQSTLNPDSVNRIGTTMGSLTALFGLLVGSLLVSVTAGRTRFRTARTLLLTLIFLETGIMTGLTYRHREAGWGFVDQIMSEDDTARFLREHLGAQRFGRNRAETPWNWGDWHNLDEHTGYISVLTRVYRSNYQSELLGNIFYVAKTPRVPGQKVVYESATGLKVFEETNAFPRAWTVHDVRRFSTTPEIDAFMQQPLATLRRTAPVRDFSGGVDRCDGREQDQIRIDGIQPAHTYVTARMQCSGLLVVSNAFYPGWKASVDGVDVALHEAYGFMQAVIVPAGEHRVELRYQPWSFYLSSIVAAVSILAVAGAARLGRSGPRVPPVEASSEAS